MEKMFFKVGPSFVGIVLCIPSFCSHQKHVIVENKGVVIDNNLLVGVGLASHFGVVLGSINLIHDGFEWCVGIPWLAELLVVVIKIIGTIFTIAVKKIS